MVNSTMPKQVLDGKLHARRPVGRPRLIWQDIRRDSSFLLNIREWRRLSGDKGYLKANYWTGQGETRDVAPFRKKNKKSELFPPTCSNKPKKGSPLLNYRNVMLNVSPCLRCNETNMTFRKVLIFQSSGGGCHISYNSIMLTFRLKVR